MQIVSSIKLQKVNLPTEPHDQENTDVTGLTTPAGGNVKTQWKTPKKNPEVWLLPLGDQIKVQGDTFKW